MGAVKSECCIERRRDVFGAAANSVLHALTQVKKRGRRLELDGLSWAARKCLTPVVTPLEATTAIHRPAIPRFKRDLSLLAAIRARHLVHLARAGGGAPAVPAAASAAGPAKAAGAVTGPTTIVTGILAGSSAIRTTRWFAETSRGVEFLFARTPHELVTAVATLQHFLRELAHGPPPEEWCPSARRRHHPA